MAGFEPSQPVASSVIFDAMLFNIMKELAPANGLRSTGPSCPGHMGAGIENPK